MSAAAAMLEHVTVQDVLNEMFHIHKVHWDQIATEKGCSVSFLAATVLVELSRRWRHDPAHQQLPGPFMPVGSG